MSQIKYFPQSAKADFFLEGEAGLIQAASTWPSNHDPQAIMVICHPHPLYGGTMNNKVVTSLVRSASHLNLASLRFNFRGVGKSEGVYGDSVGELKDLKAIVSWVKEVLPNVSICLAGFSFGAYIAASLANDPAVFFLVTIAPAVNHQNYSKLNPIKKPWLIILGDQDEVVPYQEVVNWHQLSAPNSQLITLSNASHFFHGHLLNLQAAVENGLSHSLKTL